MGRREGKWEVGRRREGNEREGKWEVAAPEGKRKWGEGYSRSDSPPPSFPLP